MCVLHLSSRVVSEVKINTILKQSKCGCVRNQTCDDAVAECGNLNPEGVSKIYF